MENEDGNPRVVLTPSWDKIHFSNIHGAVLSNYTEKKSNIFTNNRKLYFTVNASAGIGFTPVGIQPGIYFGTGLSYRFK
jgi:hypothetical protein